MAKGYPDFFGQSIFLKYGAFEQETASVAVPADTKTDIVKVETKGVLQGGYLITYDTDAENTDYLYLNVDGVEIIGQSWKVLSGYLYDLNIHSPFMLSSYDLDTPYFGIVVKDGIPFEDSVLLQYWPQGANPVTVVGELYYQAIAQ